MIPAPALFLARKAAPWLAVAGVAFGLGWSAAWHVQGLAVRDARQELVVYQQGMTKAVQAAREHEYQQNVEAQNAWSKNLDELRRTWRAGWVPVVPREGGGEGFRLPPTVRPDDPCKDAIQSARKLAADLGETTLQMNKLQARIEAQEGY